VPSSPSSLDAALALAVVTADRQPPGAELLELPHGYGRPRALLEVRRVQPPDELAQRLADQSNATYADYGYDNDASSYRQVLCLHPRRVIAWMSFPTDATRFTFPT
jgi:hypothetical protein